MIGRRNLLLGCAGLVFGTSAEAQGWMPLAIPPPRLMSSRTVQPGFGAATGSNGTTDLNSNTRSTHWNDTIAAINNLKLLYANWYVRSTASPCEVSGPNDFTITSSIEYPAGTFSADVVTTVIAGSSVFSPEIRLPVQIPAGAQFWVRGFVSVTSGQKWMIGYTVNTAAGFLEASDRNTGSSLTQGGTITGSSSGCGPIAIVATNYTGSIAAAWAGFGDSLIEGQNTTVTDIHMNLGSIGYAATGNVPYMNLGRGGLGADRSATSMAKRIDAMVKAGVTDANVALGSNDIAAGGAAATVEANLQTNYDAITVAGIRVHAQTIIPRVTVTATGKLAVPGSQTIVAGFGAGPLSVKSLVSAWTRLANASIYKCHEIADLVETGRDTGLWLTDDLFSNARILAPVNATATGVPSTTVIPTNLVNGSGITTNALASTLSAVLFTSGVANGLIRAFTSNTNFGASLTLSAALPSAPSAGDTMTIYRCSFTIDGTHPVSAGHNSVLPTYFGGALVIADYFANYIAGRDATS